MKTIYTTTVPPALSHKCESLETTGFVSQIISVRTGWWFPLFSSFFSWRLLFLYSLLYWLLYFLWLWRSHSHWLFYFLWLRTLALALSLSFALAIGLLLPLSFARAIALALTLPVALALPLVLRIHYSIAHLQMATLPHPARVTGITGTWLITGITGTWLILIWE